MKKYLFIIIPFLGILIIVVIILVRFNTGNPAKTNNPVPTTQNQPTIQTSPVPASASPEVNSSQAGTIEVTSPVNNSEFLFNNTIYYTPATLQNITPGTYTIAAHNAGYQDETFTLDVKPSEVTTIQLKMAQQTSETDLEKTEKSWVPTIQQQANQVNQQIQALQAANPLTRYLPQPFGTIMLDYDVNTDGSVQYVVYALPGKSYTKVDYLQQVEDFIQSKGIDPNTIQINWK